LIVSNYTGVVIGNIFKLRYIYAST